MFPMTFMDLRPSWDVYQRWSGGGRNLLPVAVVLGVMGTIAAWGRPHPVLNVVALVALVLLVALPAFAHVALVIRTSSLTLDAARVVHRCYGRTTTLPLDGRISGLLAPYVTPTGRGGTRTVDLLILVGAGDRPRIRLNGGYWSRADLEAVARAAGATIDAGPRSAAEWERDLPGSMGFVARRPVATAFLIVGALFALIAGLIVIGVLVSR
jgi:hypothetical protein